MAALQGAEWGLGCLPQEASDVPRRHAGQLCCAVQCCAVMVQVLLKQLLMASDLQHEEPGCLPRVQL